MTRRAPRNGVPAGHLRSNVIHLRTAILAAAIAFPGSFGAHAAERDIADTAVGTGQFQTLEAASRRHADAMTSMSVGMLMNFMVILVGLFGLNLVAAIFGAGSAPSRIVYILAGLSAVWQIIALLSAKGFGEIAAERSR